MEIVLAVLGLLAGALAFGRPRPLPRLVESVPPFEHAPTARRVVVIIPARNEAAVLPALLQDLNAQVDGADLVIVANDQSSDDTHEVAAALGALVIDVDDVPPGWTGKSWACWSAVNAVPLSPEDLLVFIDADVRLCPDAIARVVVASEHTDIVSVVPHHQVERTYEHASALFNVVGAMGIGLGGHANSIVGPLVACSVSDYLAIDGHRSVASAIAEDIELGHRFLDADRSLGLYVGADTVAYRMYPAGWSALVDGWSKNIATGSVSVPWYRSIAVAAWVTGLGASWLAFLNASSHLFDTWRSGVADNEVGPWLTWGIASVVLAITSVQVRSMLRQLGTFRAWSWWASWALWLVFVGLFLNSVRRTFVRREVRWKDRTIDLAGPAIPHPNASGT